jgi:glutathione S-transferase
MLTLLIGNKNYSSWSLRAWIMLRHAGLPFEELQVPLDLPDTAARIRAFNPAGLVPALRHDGLLVWESLAICEYACELSGKGLPRDPAARALARSASAEMHAGMRALRREWPMNIRALGRRTTPTPEVLSQIARVDALWNECRARFGAGGPWLFGEYSLADAMYAPVVLRFRTYGAAVSPLAQAYMATVLADPLLADWLAAAAAEPWIVAADEAGT